MAWPTTSDPKTEFVTLRLTVGEAATLDAAAQAAGQNRSKFVREAVRRVLAADARKAARLRGKQPDSEPEQTEQEAEA